MTVRELLARIDSRELVEWQIYYGLEPWGTETEDYRAAIVASTIANVNRDPKKQRRPLAPEAFMPRRDAKRQEEQSEGDIERIVMMWGARYGGSGQ